MNLFNLENKTVIVTGALGLIGKQHCISLSEAGANVVVADIDENKAKIFAVTLPNNAMGIYLDVTDKENIQNAKEIIMKEYGSIDVLINNAAINDMVEDPKANIVLSRFENYPLDLWNKSLQVNVTGTFLCSQVFGSQMAEQKKGSIINIASTYGIVAPNQSLYQDKFGNQNFYKPPAYSVSKSAILGLTKYLAAYWGKEGIRVNSLSPGGVKNNQDEEFVEKYSKRTPLGRMAEPTDYQGAVVFLASDASGYMNGANLIVDGGWTCW